MDQSKIDFVTCPLDDLPDLAIDLLNRVNRAPEGRVEVGAMTLEGVAALMIAMRFHEQYEMDYDREAGVIVLRQKPVY
jgi:hypothetical protein